MNSKTILKIIGITLAAPFIVNFLPFLIGGLLTYKINKTTKLGKRIKTILIAPIVITSLFIGTIWAFVINKPTTQDSKDINIQTIKQTEIQKEIPTPKTNQNIQEDITPEIKAELYKVIRVVDGDTIELENGLKVRYIGIDTPETVKPNTTVECYGKEASNKNKELVEGKMVKLEKDISETDRYGRLLRYVYIDNIFVNDILVREGYANASTYPPDVKYQEQLKQAEKEAKDNNKGLWYSCIKENTPQQNTTPVTTQPTTTNTANTNSYTCNCKKTCAQMNCEEAQYQLNTCGCSVRDGDHDGTACDTQCQ